MRLKKLLLSQLLLAVVLFSCSKDDDNDPEPVPERDRAEQEIKDQEALQEYLSTHFYNYEEFQNPSEDFDYTVRLDTIDGANADKIALIDSELLEEKVVTRNGVDYKIYILRVREGAKDRPTFADSTFVAYRGELLDQTSFDSSLTPTWFDLTRTIPGFSQTLTEFKGASGFEVNPDNTITWNNDYGVGAVFLPSGLGYFSNPQTSIPAYSPLVFTFKLYGVNETDHDGDGLLSWQEDINEDEIVGNDDTDVDLRPNYIDQDDDGDMIPTRDELVFNEDGTISFPDKDDDGTPDYLDPDN